MKTLRFKRLTTVDQDTGDNLDGLGEKTFQRDDTVNVQEIVETLSSNYVDLVLEDGSCAMFVPKNNFEVLT